MAVTNGGSRMAKAGTGTRCNELYPELGTGNWKPQMGGQLAGQGQSDQPEIFNRVFLEFFGAGKVSRKTADWAGVSSRRPELASIVEAAGSPG